MNYVSKITNKTVFKINALGEILSSSLPANDILNKFSHQITNIDHIFPGSFNLLLRELLNNGSIDAILDVDNIRLWICKLDDGLFLLEHHDMARIRHQEAEIGNLKKMVRKVEELASLGEMVAQISHELNTPLGICVTSATFLTDQLNKLDRDFSENSLTQNNLRQLLDSMQKTTVLTTSNLVRASKIINGLRDLSKDTRRHDKEKISLSLYVKEILTQLQPLLEKKKVKAQIFVSDQIMVYESPGSISQVISNLVVNSLRHGFPNHQFSAFSEIEISAKIIEGWVEVTYSDNGIGAPSEIRSKIFEPFVSGSDDKLSSGLGMSIIRDLVEQEMGGTVRLLEPDFGFSLVFNVKEHK